MPTFQNTTTLPVWDNNRAGGIKEMLAVAEINYIKQQVDKKDCSYSDVARRMGIDPRTVKNMQIRKTITKSQRKNKQGYRRF